MSSQQRQIYSKWSYVFRLQTLRLKCVNYPHVTKLWQPLSNTRELNIVLAETDILFQIQHKVLVNPYNIFCFMMIASSIIFLIYSTLAFIPDMEVVCEFMYSLHPPQRQPTNFQCCTLWLCRKCCPEEPWSLQWASQLYFSQMSPKVAELFPQQDLATFSKNYFV